MNCNHIWGLIVGSGLGSGLVTYLLQKFFEHRLNKKLYRFNKLYTDKLDIIKNLYRLLVLAEKALHFLLSQREPDTSEERADFRHTTLEPMDSFITYFEENEIVFDTSVVEIVTQIRVRFKKAKNTHLFANLFESSRGTPAWEKAVTKKQDLHKLLVEHEIPLLKEELKKEFQNKYQLLEE